MSCKLFGLLGTSVAVVVFSHSVGELKRNRRIFCAVVFFLQYLEAVYAFSIDFVAVLGIEYDEEFIKENSEALKDKRLAAAVSFSGGGADKALAALAELTAGLDALREQGRARLEEMKK